MQDEDRFDDDLDAELPGEDQHSEDDEQLDDPDVDDDGDEDDGDDYDEAPKSYDEAYVKKLRREAARTRRKAREDTQRAADEAAERAREDFARDLFGALGLDEDDEPAPDEVIAYAEERARSSDAKLRAYEVKDAVREAAREHGGDIDLLMPFLRGKGLLDDLDPTDEDFGELVSDIVETAISRNSKLKADAPAPRRSGGDMTGGSSEKPGKTPKSIDDFREARRKHRSKKFGVEY